MNKHQFLASTLCAALLLLGCGQQSTQEAAAPASAPAAPPAASGDTIKVGVLHSLSGTMAISESALKDTVLMLIDEQNQ